MDTAEVSRKLGGIRDVLASRAGFVLNVTSGAEALDAALKAAAVFGRFGPPAAANPRCRERASFTINAEEAEVWTSPSLQTGFAALSLPAAPYGSRQQAADAVLSHELSTGALWESIRMKGGAYGAFARPASLEGVDSVCTYRDPAPFRSLKTIPALLRERSKQGSSPHSGETLEKSIIGTFARETVPRTPAANGSTDFLRYLYGVTPQRRHQRLKDIVSLQAEETAAAARRLADASENILAGCPVIIADEKTAEKAAAALGVPLQTLPA
jgi:Zn-dependent M16 (insulinase) family peptidase